MNKKWVAAMIGAAAMTLSGAALAQQGDTGWYVSGSLGNAEVDIPGAEDSTAWRIAGGYKINRTFGAELGYANLGDFGGGGDDVTSLELAATASFPLANQFSLYGLVGFARLEAGSEEETELMFGVGAQYDVSRNLGVRLKWHRYDTDEAIDVLSLGVVWKF